MSLLHLSRPRGRSPEQWARLLHLPGRRTAAGVVLLLWVAVCGLLALVPRWWIAGWAVQYQERWFLDVRNKASRLPQIWEHSLGQVPAFTRGDEPEVRDYLVKECLTWGIVDPDARRVWLRDGERLRPAREGEAPTPLDLAQRARASGSFRWLPEGTREPSWRDASSVVAFDRQWCLLKRWKPGSPEVDRWLAQVLDPRDGYRFGIGKFGSEGRNQKFTTPDRFPPIDRNAAPRSLQVVELREAPFILDPGMSLAFGGNWQVIVMMGPGELQVFRDAYLFRRRMAWLAYASLVGVSAVGLSMFLFSQQRERVQADRLASLAHSLKTPLAVLKSRCDTVLNEDLPPETRQAHLLHIGGEVSHLTRLIETGLEETRQGDRKPAGDRIDGAFFEELDEEMSPAFEAKGRQLEVYGNDVVFRAHLSALRTALVTLVENALLHGRGTVEVKALREGHRILLLVRDEGPGLPAEAAASLLSGRPGAVPPGDGRGLGLLMLRKVAQDEGWGLVLENLEPGFLAALEIRG